MEAFPVGATGHIPQPTPPPMTGAQMIQQPGGTAATMPAGYSHPTPGQSQPVAIPHASGQGAALGAGASGVYDPASSLVTAPKKSKAGVIVAIIALLVVGGGIAAVMVLGGDKKRNEAGGDGSGSQVVVDDGSGSDQGVTPDQGSGSALVTNDTGSGSGSDTQANSGSGSDVATNDQGSGNQGSDDGSATLPPPPEAIGVAVFTQPYVNDFEIWENGKKLQDGTEDLMVTPGTPRTIVVKARGFKDSKPVVVTAKKSRVRVKLVAVGGSKPDHTTTTNNKPPGIDCSSAIKDPKNKQCVAQYCAGHADDLRCDAE
jgi:hypothetical protein